MFTCAYFSRKLNDAERNCDMGDRELLAIKEVFSEWVHRREGQLSHSWSTSMANPRQARWCLFFSCFQFQISYQPCSKNVKAVPSPHQLLARRL